MSQHRPQTPSRASISRIRCPFPIPPNEGLQDISPKNEAKQNSFEQSECLLSSQ